MKLKVQHLVKLSLAVYKHFYVPGAQRYRTAVSEILLSTKPEERGPASIS